MMTAFVQLGRLIVAFACLGVMAGFAAQPPNVLLVLTDDQGYGDFSLHGNPVLQTPAFDRFGREGIQFERFFVSPVCAPTRASLLTGRWWLRGGVWGVTQSKENLRPGEVTLAEAFKTAGYRTGIFGKWHNGEQFPSTPPGQGFDEFLGFNNGHWNGYFDPQLIRGSQPAKTKGYIADVLTDAAIDFIARNRSHPFFCYVPFNTPHSPYQAPDRYFNQFKAQGLDDVLAAVYAMCANIDDNFGRLLAALDQHGLRENTIVLFLADNGASTDRFNAGMRGRKSSVHEGGTRVPLLVQWPARFKQPRVISQIAAHIDLYPTLLELSGVKPPPGPKVDGLSLVPLLEGRVANWPDRMLFTHQAGPNVAQPVLLKGGVRTQQYRAVFESAGGGKKSKGGAGGWQLYDMIADAAQERDIATEKPEVVKRLAAGYEEWFRDVTRDGFAKPLIPVGYAEHDPVRLYAPQANLDGTLRFFGGQGYAHDWITSWTEVKSKVMFELDVVRAGTFEVEIGYGCPAEDAGAKVRMSIGRGALEGTVVAAPAPRLPLPHRAGGSDTYVNREWAALKLGQLELATGPQTLTLEALTRPGTQVLELKHVQLKRVR